MPTLFEDGDGYLKTHVHVEEIENELKKKFGEDFQLKEKDLTEKANPDGNTSLLATFERDGKKLLVKLPTCVKLRPMFTNENQGSLENLTKMVHNREIDFYEELLPKAPNMNVPQFVCGKKFDGDSGSGFSVMEMVKGRNLMTHEYAGFEATKQMLDNLAALAAISVKLSPEELKEHSNVPQTILDIQQIYFNKKSFGVSIDRLIAYIPEEKELFEEIRHFAIEKDLVNAEQLLSVNKRLGLPPVFVHADFWRGNVLFNETNQESFELSTILDWQCQKMGNPGEDLAKLYTFAVDKSHDFKSSDWEDLLKYYYSRLEHHLGEEKAPYTYDELLSSFNECLPPCALLVISYHPFNAESDKRKGLPESEWEAAKQMIVSNAVYIIRQVRDLLKAK
ncbi:unnamed protein product, partial [Mesorhabditis belari]|uniref:CHK kinase-like domain-containing protein n=1 Tax=Mesorhabditis belari TaxID=2138241 RepID=A0AAF3EKL0_9BILA